MRLLATAIAEGRALELLDASMYASLVSLDADDHLVLVDLNGSRDPNGGETVEGS